MSLYERGRAAASQLLRKNRQGEAYYLVQEEQAGANPWDDPIVTSERVSLDVAAVGVTQADTDNRVTMDDIMLSVSLFGHSPKVGNIIELDGVQRQVLRVRPVPAAGRPMLWKIAVKG